jgi:hypothetical protein
MDRAALAKFSLCLIALARIPPDQARDNDWGVKPGRRLKAGGYLGKDNKA